MKPVSQIKSELACARIEDRSALEALYGADERKGVRQALAQMVRRFEREAVEEERLAHLYETEARLGSERGGGIICGLDEVGRGPLAGPVAAGAVVLDPSAPRICGLDDSKKLSSGARERISEEIRGSARACAVAYAPPQMIDERGIMYALRHAFTEALACIERQSVSVDVVLLDGDPLGFDAREVNVVKGDATCASIAAASIIAKVERDRLMEQLDAEHPGYGFATHKGYGSSAHIQAIRELGLSTVHRRSFCTRIA